MPQKPASPISPPSEQRALLTHNRLLGRRIYFHVLIRFVVAAFVAAAAIFGSTVVGIDQLDVTDILIVAACIAAYNVLILIAVAPLRVPGSGSDPDQIRMLRILKHVSTLLDYLALTAVIWYLGGIRSPFIAFYLFHLIIASTLLPLRGAIISALTAAGMLIGLAVVEITGVLPPQLPEGVVLSTAPLEPRTIATILVVYLFLFGLITAMVSNLAVMLRQGERTLLDQADKLEQLNNQRRELLHLTLHNLQAPVAAAAMLLRNLRNGLCGPLETKQSEQVNRSLIRLDSITGFIQDLGLLSKLESGDLTDQIERVDIAPMLEQIASEHRERADEHGHSITVEPPPPIFALGVPRLVREAVVNYVTNAIKYSPAGGEIRINASARDGWVRVQVSDRGIGIAHEKQDRVFDEYVRLAPKDPRLGKVEGTGLGLSIVKTSIERQGGRVGFHSEPGKGSTFWLELPAARIC